MSTNTTNTSNSHSTAENSAYLDPHTTVAEGYTPRTPRWRLLVTKLQTSLHKSSHRKSLSLDSHIAAEMKARAAALDSRNVVSLTERNLTEFFNPDYSDEMDVFKDPKSRENPFDNPRRKERVGQWIENLP